MEGRSPLPARNTIADALADLIHERGPQRTEDLARGLVAAGRTKAKDPVLAARSRLANDERFLQLSDDRWGLLSQQLHGAIFCRRLSAVERRYRVLIMDEADALLERLISSGHKAVAGGVLRVDVVQSYFDLPWDDDGLDWPSELSPNAEPEADEEFGYLMARRWRKLVLGPMDWIPAMESRCVIGFALQQDGFSIKPLRHEELTRVHVQVAAECLESIVRNVLDSGDQTSTASVRSVLETAAVLAPDIFRQPLPPLADLMSSRGLEIADGLIGAAGSLSRHRWSEISRIPRSIAVEDGFDTAIDDQYHDHMVMKLTATEVKAKMLALLEQVAAGEVIEITKRGRTIARLVPATSPHGLKGSMLGLVVSNGSDEDLFGTGEAWEAA
jgi:prevent-host-death family protein